MDGKRRLPPWMSRASNPEQNDEKDPSSREVVLLGKRVNKEGEGPEADSSLLPKHGKKNSSGGDLQQKEKRFNAKKRIQKTVAPRKRRKVTSKELDNGEERKALSSNEEDEELTVEDLMDIAKEYVEKANNEKEAQHQREAPTLNKQLSESSLCFRNESRSGVTSQDAERSELPRTSTISTFFPSFTCSSILKDKETTLKKGDPETCGTVDRRITGDPAQDMLDLFLGPLLKKPQVQELQEPKFDVIMDPDVGLASGLSKNSVSQKIVVPLATKKKSSLKDKVTMFLG